MPAHRDVNTFNGAVAIADVAFADSHVLMVAIKDVRNLFKCPAKVDLRTNAR